MDGATTVKQDAFARDVLRRSSAWIAAAAIMTGLFALLAQSPQTATTNSDSQFSYRQLLWWTQLDVALEQPVFIPPSGKEPKKPGKVEVTLAAGLIHQTFDNPAESLQRQFEEINQILAKSYVPAIPFESKGAGFKTLSSLITWTPFADGLSAPPQTEIFSQARAVVAQQKLKESSMSSLDEEQCVTTHPDRPHFGVDAYDRLSRMTIHSKEITREIQSDARWIRAGAKGYWSTLTWRDYQVCGDAPIPMISENSLPVLSKILDIRIQNSAGIVFGVVPKGWKIRLAGRAEKPIVIDSDKNPSSMDAIEIDRSFLFLNVSPGTHVLRISPAQNGSTDRVHASVVLPVVEGHATHVNLGKIHSVSLKGTVIDGASAMSQAVSGVTLKVVGANIKIKTEPSGKFEIPAAYQVSNYPLWIDAHAESGYTHRYRVSKRLGDLKFYLFSSDYIRGLLDQLSGLVHPDAGLLLGTAPALAAKAEASTLLPTAGVVSGESTMFPEAYTLSTDNRLLTETPLDNQTYRFAALLPEGVNLMELVDKSQRARWSEMVFSSPGIVNITDPK